VKNYITLFNFYHLIKKINIKTMKKNLLYIALVGLILLTFETNAQSNKCATMEILNKRISRDPSIAERMKISEIKTQKWVAEHPKQKRGISGKFGTNSSLRLS
jgi:hypothetical protein